MNSAEKHKILVKIYILCTSNVGTIYYCYYNLITLFYAEKYNIREDLFKQMGIYVFKLFLLPTKLSRFIDLNKS